MGVLLDTPYLYRLMRARASLSGSERQFLERQHTPIHVSAVSVWEMRLKYQARDRLGRRKSPFDPREAVAALTRLNVVLLPLTMRHAAERLRVPTTHRDPFDELLLVQAQVEGLRLLTADEHLVGHPLAITP